MSPNPAPKKQQHEPYQPENAAAAPAEAPQHPRHELSEVLHQPVRFSIAAALARTETMDFKDLRNTIQVSDSVLSKQLSTLEKAGFVEIKKAFVGKFPRTSVRLTAAGHEAWGHHMETLRRIAGG
ncbi:DNA-binding HxlR family transcriptional regulator [Arthrobacter stackebrandtii]|uniref:DNA-binding HxlR family transcriptional regulator n=1 Tax=Arthrobacter stackebrandtii TaxID=272161 RepID=A0ABS4YRQ8_9MICC|nr:transcriptional regulator [Arthrobacter stackebrandtii]MBP2411483.1 DNA-binding HxlR family transcriptional regulator [Arthrobacter stackebrandtii]PYH00244.1 ArsR family transcriptional regulator [Arthrobacter stackebrandtii]